VSSEVPDETVVRAVCFCPECIEQRVLNKYYDPEKEEASS
jgi:hypothetical protein